MVSSSARNTAAVNLAVDHHRGITMWKRELLDIELDDKVDSDPYLLSSLAAGNPPTLCDTGIRALMLAVLEDGIRSALSPVPQVRTEALLWLSHRRQRSPFSFVVVCETLGLDADAVRSAIGRMHNRRATGPASTSRRRFRSNVRPNSPLRATRSAG